MSLVLPINAAPRNGQNSFTQLQDEQGTDLSLFINTEDLSHDLSHGDVDLRLYFDGQSLLREQTYPQNLKLEVSILVDGEKSLVSLINRTVKNKKAAENIFFAITLPRIEKTDELIFDLYDSHNVLHSTYLQEVSISVIDGFESNLESIPDFHCSSTDGVCLIEYLLRHVTFSANFDNALKTTIYKNDKGRFFVNIPIKKGRQLGKKVRGVSVSGSSSKGKSSGNGKSNNGTYPYFEDGEEVASNFWNDVRDAIAFTFTNSNKSFQFKQDGSLQLSTSQDRGYLNIAGGTGNKAPIVLSEGQLLTSPIDGAIEYDGSNLYFTKGGTRALIGSGGGGTGPQGPQGPAGPAGPQGAAGAPGIGVDLSNGGYLTDAINFITNGKLQDAVFNGSIHIPTGASDSFVLTSDANGFASWQAASSGGSSVGAAGTIQFSDGSGGFNGDPSNFFWDDSSNRLTLNSLSVNGVPFIDGNNRLTTDNLRRSEDTFNRTFWISHDGASTTARVGAGNTSFSESAYLYLNNSAPVGGLVILGNTILSTRLGTQPLEFNPSNANKDFTFHGDNNDDVLRIDASKDAVGINTTNADAMLDIEINAATEEGLIVKGAVAQTANLTEWQNGGGTVFAHVNAAGDFSNSQGFTSAEAFGNNSQTSDFSVVIGRNAEATSATRSVVIGNNANVTDSQPGAILIGFDADGPGSNSTRGGTVVIGREAGASSKDAVVIGADSNTTAIGTIAIGFRTSAGSNYSGVAIGYQANASLGGIAIGRQATTTGSSDFVVGGNLNPISNFYLGDGVTNASPADSNIRATSGSGTDIAGADLSFTAGRPTGSGTGGDLIFQTANGGAAGTTLRDLHERVRITQGGTTRITGNFEYIDGNQANGLVLTSDANGLASWQAASSGASSSGVAGSIQFSDGSGGFNSDAANFFWDDSNGRLGIGTDSPDYLLTINGNAGSTSGLNISNLGTAGIAIDTRDSGLSGSSDFYMRLGSGTYWRADGAISIPSGRTIKFSGSEGIYGHTGTGEFRIAEHSNFDTVNIYTDGNIIQTLDINGNVGFGFTDPQAKLDINGQLAIRDGTEANGLVLTSDANGLASWQASSATGDIESVGDCTNGACDDFTLTAAAAGTIPLVIAANAAQTAHLTEWRDSGSNLRAHINPNGDFTNAHGETQSEVFGENANVDNNRSTAIGYGADAIGEDAVAVGRESYARTRSVAIGTNATTPSSREENVAIGYDADVSSASNRAIAIGAYADAAATESIAIGRGATTTAGNQLVIGAGTFEISDVYIGEGVTDASPTSTAYHATGGSGSNIAGADLSFAAGQGTGSGAGGDLIFQTANGGAAGSTLRDLHERMRINDDGSIVINEDGESVNGLRVETDSNTHALYVQNTGSRVAVNTSTMTNSLNIGGDRVAIFQGGSGSIRNVDTIRTTTAGAARLTIESGEVYMGGGVGASKLSIVPQNTVATALGLKQAAGGTTTLAQLQDSAGTVTMGLTTTGFTQAGAGNGLARYDMNHTIGPGSADGDGVGLNLRTENVSGTLTDVAHIDTVFDDISAHQASLRFSIKDDSSSVSAPSEAMRLNHNGDLAIGLTSPARKLHISEAMRIEPEASPPSSATLGDLYVDTSGALCFYDGASWSVAAGSGSCI